MMPREKSSLREAKRQWIRLAKLLSRKAQNGLQYETVNGKIEISSKGRTHRFALELVGAMLAEKSIESLDTRVRLTENGLRKLAIELGLMSEETEIRRKSILPSPPVAKTNINESPLMRLYNRRTSSGKTYLSHSQFQAGEKLRQDFERGQLQPKVSAAFDRAVGSSGSRSGAASAIEISDFALDARNRVKNAIEFLGPELSGVALDICCFLKGFELVEREREWPPRSAKLMLRTALSQLAIHYGFERNSVPVKNTIRFWGEPDYRPAIT
ncbi:MAG: DUF6456 domain-containing protein [Rhizobiaceae bacterium]